MGLAFPRAEGFEVRPLFEFADGEAEISKVDKEGLVGLLRWAIEERLQVKSQSHPILLVDSPFWSKDLREYLISMFFETFEVPALFLGRSPVLAAIASGKHTGLVVDLGASGVHVCPVFDGYVVKTACFSQKVIGGDNLTNQCKAMLVEHDLLEQSISALPIEIGVKKAVDLGAKPDFQRKSIRMDVSFRTYHEKKILEDFKESTVQVVDSTLSNEADVAMRPPKYYEFPSGFNRNFGFDRFRLGEILFQPNKYTFHKSSEDFVMSEPNANPSSVIGLSDMIQRAIQACDVDLRSSVASNVMLCGGGASIQGLSERLNADLNRMPTFGRVRVQLPTTTNERRNAAWIGGSILGSLGSFQQLWLTRQEFQEHGPSYIERKSP